MRASDRTFQFCTEVKNEWSCNFTADCLQGVEINSAQGKFTFRKDYLHPSSQFFWCTCICICLMSHFKIQFHCTAVGRPAHWCHCCVTHAIGSRDMPAVHTTFHFASNSSCGLLNNILFSDTSRSFDCECFCLKWILFVQKNITWGYINIIFCIRIFLWNPFTNGRPSNNLFWVAVPFTQKTVCCTARNNRTMFFT
jgi:hypothetical protein